MKFRCVTGVLLLGLCLAEQLPAQPSAHAAAPSCIAIVDVNVVPMDREHVLANQTVLVRGDRIESVAPSTQLTSYKQCAVLDGRSHYLIPGLVDSHVHLPLNGRQDQLLTLNLLLLNGITTGINMEGSAAILALRNEIRDKHLDLPTLFSAGAFIQQPAFMTADQVTREVRTEKAAGYDFIKIHGDLTKEADDAAFDTAKQVHIRVVGHVPANLGIDAALGRQSLIVHAEEYIYSFFQFHRDLPTDPAEIDRMVKEIAERTAESGTWVSPTLSVFHQIILQAADVNTVLTRPEMHYMPRHMTTGAAVGAVDFGWYPPHNIYVKRWAPSKIPYLLSQYSIMLKLTRALRDAGVPLLAGTDPFVPCVVPGFSMKDEFDQLYSAGLTPYEVLLSATANGARFLQEAQQIGEIEPGMRADMVLLSANPLENVDNVFEQDGVFLHGKWISRDDLQKSLDAAVEQSKLAFGD